VLLWLSPVPPISTPFSSCFSVYVQKLYARLTIGTVADPVRNQNAKGNGELLQSDERPTNTGRRELGIVHGHEHRQGADTHTGKPTTGPDTREILIRARLDSDAHAKEHGPRCDRVFARVDVGDGTGADGACKSTEFWIVSMYESERTWMVLVDPVF
jgi:hypothetical protein